MSAVGSATQAPALKRQSAAQPSAREVEAEKQKKADAEIDIAGAVAPKAASLPLATSGAVGTLVNALV